MDDEPFDSATSKPKPHQFHPRTIPPTSPTRSPPRVWRPPPLRSRPQCFALARPTGSRPSQATHTTFAACAREHPSRVSALLLTARPLGWQSSPHWCLPLAHAPLELLLLLGPPRAGTGAADSAELHPCCRARSEESIDHGATVLNTTVDVESFDSATSKNYTSTTTSRDISVLSEHISTNVMRQQRAQGAHNPGRFPLNVNGLTLLTPLTSWPFSQQLVCQPLSRRITLRLSLGAFSQHSDVMCRSSADT